MSDHGGEAMDEQSDEIQPLARPVSTAQASTSGQFQAGLPPTVQRGAGSSPRCLQISTVGRLTPSLSATSEMPTGSQSSMSGTVGKVLTPGKECVDNHYMTSTPKCDLCGRAIRRDNLSLTSTKYPTGYRHMACNERNQPTKKRTDERWRCGDCGWVPSNPRRMPTGATCPQCRGDFRWVRIPVDSEG